MKYHFYALNSVITAYRNLHLTSKANVVNNKQQELLRQPVKLEQIKYNYSSTTFEKVPPEPSPLSFKERKELQVNRMLF